MMQMPDVSDIWIREMEQERADAEEEYKRECYCSNCGDFLEDGFYHIEGGKYCRNCGEMWFDDKWEELNW